VSDEKFIPNFTEWRIVTVRGEIRPTSRDK